MEKSITYYKKRLLREIDTSKDLEERSASDKSAMKSAEKSAEKAASQGEDYYGGPYAAEKTSYKQKGVTCEMCKRYEDAKKDGKDQEAEKIKLEIVKASKEIKQHSKESSWMGRIGSWVKKKIGFGGSDSGSHAKHESLQLRIAKGRKGNLDQLILESIVERHLLEEANLLQAIRDFVSKPANKDQLKKAEEELKNAPPPPTSQEVMTAFAKIAPDEAKQVTLDIPKATGGIMAGRGKHPVVKTKDGSGEGSEETKKEVKQPLQEMGIELTIIALAPVIVGLAAKLVSFITDGIKKATMSAEQKDEFAGLQAHKDCLSDFAKKFDKENDHDVSDSIKMVIDHLDHELTEKSSLFGISAFLTNVSHFNHALYLGPFKGIMNLVGWLVRRRYGWNEETQQYKKQPPKTFFARIGKSEKFREFCAEVTYATIFVFLSFKGFLALKDVLASKELWTQSLKASPEAIEAALASTKGTTNLKDALVNLYNSF